MKHWTIGATYKDHKRNTECTLVAVSPYKAKSGCYLDFQYNNGKYIRQSANKALSRFEKISEHGLSQTGTDIMSQFVPAKNITTQIESFIENTVAKAMPKNKRGSKQDVPIRYANVIYVDFIKKCRIHY